jgi:hypothetical protein
MKVPYTKSVKCGNVVWQCVRYGQICYAAFIPFNPRTPAQVAVRGNFAEVSKRWRTLTQEQRDVWIAIARTQWSKPRLFQRGRLTGCQFFVKTNVALANQGKPQLDLPWDMLGPANRRLGRLSSFFIHPSAFNTSLPGFLSQNRTHGEGGPLKIPCLHRSPSIPTP